MECGPNLRRPVFKGKADGREKRALTQNVHRDTTRAHTRSHTHMSAYTCPYTNPHVHTRIHTHRHGHTCIHAHTAISASSLTNTAVLILRKRARPQERRDGWPRCTSNFPSPGTHSIGTERSWELWQTRNDGHKLNSHFFHKMHVLESESSLA